MRDLETLTFDEVQHIVDGPAFLPEQLVPSPRIALPVEALPQLQRIEGAEGK